jgi:ribosomal protein L12E/L44/L45/RPP1/RPP2
MPSKPRWPALFAKAFAGRKLTDVLSGGAPAQSAAPTGAKVTETKAAAPAKQEAKKEEKKEDEDMGGPIGLFGEDEDY